jgi:hypothetical protein
METPERDAVEAELRELAARYAVAVDQRDVQLLLSVFEPDATLAVVPSDHARVRASEMAGHSELAGIPGVLDRYQRTFHFVGQSTYLLTADGTASGLVYCLAHHLRVAEGRASDFVMFIRYHDIYGRRDGSDWKIRRREVVVDWTETRTADGV